jgi:hypothetical protein
MNAQSGIVSRNVPFRATCLTAAAGGAMLKPWRQSTPNLLRSRPEPGSVSEAKGGRLPD